MDKYLFERDGQLAFYKRFLPRVDKNLKAEDVLIDDTDGVVNGNLLEFKLNVKDLNAALFQAIKYLSAFRIKGRPVPSGIDSRNLPLTHEKLPCGGRIAAQPVGNSQ